jgi:hypothetical protein
MRRKRFCVLHRECDRGEVMERIRFKMLFEGFKTMLGREFLGIG